MDINEVRKKYNKEYREKNKELFKERDKKYYAENKERFSQRKKEYNKEYRELNIEKIKEYRNQRKENGESKKYEEKRKEKRKTYLKQNINRIRFTARNRHTRRVKTDPLYNLTRNIRGLIHQSLKRMKISETSKTKQILGCSFEEFKTYLENHFEP